jgi:hypothetical protein
MIRAFCCCSLLLTIAACAAEDGNGTNPSGGTAGASGISGSTGGSDGMVGQGGDGVSPTGGSSGSNNPVENDASVTAGAGGAGGISGAGGASGGGGSAAVSAVSVVTNHYDNARSGSNTSETILTTANVNQAKFGLLFSRTIVGSSYGQPLYVGGVTVNGAKHNVVYVATEHNMVYAFDADSAAATAPLWSKMLPSPLVLGGGGYDPGCSDMHDEVGITSTPVISVADNRIYVVAKISGGQHLHALDLATGADAPGSPATIGAATTGFNPNIHLNRTGLLLLNGIIYIAYGSHCDAGGYHGWLFGLDAKTLQQTSVYNTTNSGTLGAIWQSGLGLASEGTGVWACVGNGTSGGENMSQNVIRLLPGGAAMTVTNHYQAPTSGDNDLSAGVVFVGDTGQVVSGGKDGDILLLAKTDLALKQKISLGGELHSLVFWNGSAGPMVYGWPDNGTLHAYQAAGGQLVAKGTNNEKKPGHPAGIFTISSNGTTAGTGIVWASLPTVGDAWHATAKGALYAYDAADITKPSLWNSTLDAKDDVGNFAKFSPPTVANGKVYLATFSGKLQVYGLK